ncbi:hypothetical protein [Peribacillus butanolivorans]|uniref:hypothetical protein n=1 Tax=Peribacillus butanolivorans TaxID=421767 RepID=UPI00366B4183
MLSLLETVASFIKRLLWRGNQKVRRIKLINQIKEKLAEYEDYFYRNNLKVDSDARDLLLKIDDFLNKWEWFYLGFIRWESKEVDLKDVQHVELLLKELSYISLYKRFEKYTQRVVVVDLSQYFGH